MSRTGDGPRGEDALVALAREAMERAYAPYSRFRVGAAIEAEDGRRFGGCNVENAAYPVGLCAERVALGHAVASGARAFRRIAIATAAAEPTPPCGMCRQALGEFGLELEVVSVAGDGTAARWRLRELLPDAFVRAPGARGDPADGEAGGDRA
ncbi:MAG: cytidine deaminase, partial [Gemmatimonadota bacterium]